MNILIVSSLRRRLDPHINASRTQVIYNLANGLIKRGHKVSIMAPQNSKVAGATIIPVIPRSLNELPPFENQFYAESAYLVALARTIQKRAAEFDIVHNHTYPEYINLLIEDTLPVPMVTTLHAPVTPELENVLSFFPKANIVAQSDLYRKLVKSMNIPWVIHNGVDEAFFAYSGRPRDYLLWVGRLGQSKNSQGQFFDGKGVGDAIKVAGKLGRKLTLIGSIEDMEFYNQAVLPNLSENIQWISDLSSVQSPRQLVRKTMQGAKALIFPTKFEEAFGLTVAEALSCGTPVVAYSRGSVPEIIKDGKTGFLVKPDSISDLCHAVERIYAMDQNSYQKMQKAARKLVEENFTIDKMVKNYEQLYNQLTNKLLTPAMPF